MKRTVPVTMTLLFSFLREKISRLDKGIDLMRINGHSVYRLLRKMKPSGDSKRLDELIQSLLRNTNCQYRISISEISFLIPLAKRQFMSEATVLDLHPPLHICGDLHGQFPDLLRIFEMGEAPPNARYLFLGDYVDRGPMGLEVLILLVALKVRYPNHVYLLRGNHETREMTAEYGFTDECVAKTNRNTYNDICDMFDMLPIAALISNKFLCIHGGITPTLKELSQIREIARPADASCKGFLADLLWSDPNRNVNDWAPSDRGDTVFWSLNPVKKFLEDNNLRMLIRAHQMVMGGFEYPFDPDESVITVFSAPCYAGMHKNKGAFITIDKNLNVNPSIIPYDPFSMAAANKMMPVSRPETPCPGKGGKGKGGKGKGGRDQVGGGGKKGKGRR